MESRQWEMDLSSWFSLALRGIGYYFLWKIISFLYFECFYNISKKDVINGRYKLVTIKGLPIIGNLLDVLPQFFISRMYKYYQNYRGYNLKFEYLGETLLLLTRYEDIMEALTKRPKFFHRSFKFKYFNETAGFEYGLFGTNGDMWNYMRRFITPSFNSSNVHRHLEEIWELSNQWTKGLWLKNSKVFKDFRENDDVVRLDMTKESMFFTLRVINHVAFGQDIDQHFQEYLYNPQFVEDIESIMTFGIEGSMFPFPTIWFPYVPYYGTIYQKAMASNARMEAIAQKILHQRKEKIATTSSKETNSNNHKSIIDILLSKKEMVLQQSDFTDEQFEQAIIQNIKTLYLAGGETTSVTISWMIYYLSLPEHQGLVKVLQSCADSFYEKHQLLGKRKSTDGNYSPTDNDYEFVSNPFQEKEGVISLSPEVLIQEELTCFYYFWKETLRLASPAIFLMLTVDKPYRLASSSIGITSSNTSSPSEIGFDPSCDSLVIQPNQEVFVYVEGLLKDPEVFPEPDSFQPDRWQYDKHPEYSLEVRDKMEKYFLAFGAGPRVCPGMQLSMFETIFAIVAFVYRYESELACDRKEILRILGTTAHANQVPIFIKRRQ